MRVELSNNWIIFRIHGNVIELKPRACGGFYIYFNNYEIPCDKELVEKIINEERADMIRKLTDMARRFSDVRTREKYIDVCLESDGDFKTSRELTSELRKRATIKTRRCVGFRISNKICGWIFMGRFYKNMWRAWLIPDSLEFIGRLVDYDVDVKNTILKILNGDYEKLERFSIYEIDKLDYFALSNLIDSMKDDAEKWDIDKMRETVGLLTMMQKIS